jgi:hypothetical protein
MSFHNVCAIYAAWRRIELLQHQCLLRRMAALGQRALRVRVHCSLYDALHSKPQPAAFI